MRRSVWIDDFMEENDMILVVLMFAFLINNKILLRNQPNQNTRRILGVLKNQKLQEMRKS